MDGVILLIYIAAGYWATGKTVYRNKIIVSTGINFFMSRLIVGGLFGLVLIPWALIVEFASKR